MEKTDPPFPPPEEDVFPPDTGTVPVVPQQLPGFSLSSAPAVPPAPGVAINPGVPMSGAFPPSAGTVPGMADSGLGTLPPFSGYVSPGLPPESPPGLEQKPFLPSGSPPDVGSSSPEAVPPVSGTPALVPQMRSQSPYMPPENFPVDAAPASVNPAMPLAEAGHASQYQSLTPEPSPLGSPSPPAEPSGAMVPVASHHQYASLPGEAGMYGSLPQAGEYGAGFSEEADRIIPRISIEAFFERPAVQSTISAASGDRRMSDASVTIIPGGLPAAIARYAHHPNPNVILVESSLPGPQIISQLDQLANFCDENVKVMVVGVTNDVELYRELMRRGVSEYLVPPFQPLQLIRAIAGLVEDPDSPFSGKCIAVCGVKGGVGASTIAHNLAWECAERMQMATTLVDFDLNFGTASLNFNQDKIQSIADALASPDRFDASVVSRMATRITDNLSLLNAPSTLDSGFEFEACAYRTIVNEIRKTVPLLIMDMPTSWSTAVRTPLLMADHVVIVSTPDLASLRNTKNMVDFLVAKRPNDSPPHLLLNMVGVPGRPEISEKEFVSALGMSPEAIIHFEPRLFGTAANNGKMLASVSPDAKCVRILDSLATSLTGREPIRSSGGMGSFIGRLFVPAK